MPKSPTDKVVTHYGLHIDQGVAYLHQGRGASNFIGLARKSPFSVQPHKNKPCNHLINTASPIPDPMHWLAFTRVAEDPLVQAMLPLPKVGAGVYFVDDPNDLLALKLIMLSKMTTPIQPAVRRLWMVGQTEVLNEVQMSNVQPLVLTGVATKDQPLVTELARTAAYYPRTVIFTGSPDLIISASMKRLQTKLFDVDEGELANLPMESIGALILRRYARREDLLAPVEFKKR